MLRTFSIENAQRQAIYKLDGGAASALFVDEDKVVTLQPNKLTYFEESGAVRVWDI